MGIKSNKGTIKHLMNCNSKKLDQTLILINFWKFKVFMIFMRSIEFMTEDEKVIDEV